MSSIPIGQLEKNVKLLRDNQKTIVLTTGVFDILNLGHLYYLEDAKKLADCLIVGVDNDKLVKRIKGPKRPIYTEKERAGLIAGLKPVDYTVIFSDIKKLVTIVNPDFFIVSPTTKLNPPSRPELKLVIKLGGKIKSISSRSLIHTSVIIDEICHRYGN